MAAASTAPAGTAPAPTGTEPHGSVGPVAHHFNNLPQQQQTQRFGMWLFLVTEVLFFGGAFVAYTAYRIWFPKDFEAGSAALNVGIASVNTFLLLLSSLTVTLAIRSCYVGNRKGLIGNLVLTILLGSAFLGLKAREYYLDFEEGLVPGGLAKYGGVAKAAGAGAKPHEHGPVGEEPASHDTPTEAFNANLVHALHDYKVKGADGKERPAVAGQDYEPSRVQLFFMFYYSMTGLHVLHMVVGLGLLTWQLVLAVTRFFDHSARYVYVETLSLYWHFVDMVWMFLLPLLYLAGPHSWTQAGQQFQLALGMGGH